MASSAASTTSGPAQKVQSAAVEHGYPHGHIGHLTEQEEEAFRNFKLLLTEQAIYKPGPPASHDDPVLLRFLRARKWDVQEAYKQFKDTEDWRSANHLPLLYDTINLDAYDQSRRLYPQWTGRRDKRGIPLYVFEIKALDNKTIAAYEQSAANSTDSKAPSDGNTPAKLLRLFALYEHLIRFVHPLCTELPDREHAERTPITLSTNIVDVSGVGLKQFWDLKSHMQAASQLATAHYPETLDRIFIIGAPFFFTTVWGWIKRWFDPITVSKMFILSAHEVKPVLESFIDPANIPTQYGGTLDFAWGQMPNLDPVILERVTWAEGFSDFPTGPVYWRPLAGEDETVLECIAVGSVDGKERHERVCTIRRVYRGEDVGPAKEEPATEEEPAPEQEVPAAEERPAETTAEASPAVTNGIAEDKAPAVSSGVLGVEGVENLSLQDQDELPKGAELAEKPVAQTVAA